MAAPSWFRSCWRDMTALGRDSSPDHWEGFARSARRPQQPVKSSSVVSSIVPTDSLAEWSKALASGASP